MPCSSATPMSYKLSYYHALQIMLLHVSWVFKLNWKAHIGADCYCYFAGQYHSVKFSYQLIRVQKPGCYSSTQAWDHAS